MSVSICLITAFDDESSPQDVSDSCVLNMIGNLIIFSPNHLIPLINVKRKVSDPNLQNTIIIATYKNNCDAYNLYYDKLNQIIDSDTKKIFYNILKLNRLAYIRDIAMKNPFHASHFLWVDSNAKLECNVILNYSICVNKITHFGTRDLQGNLFIDDTVFCIPQDMAWAYYHWNKLEHQNYIHNGQLLSYNIYFQILSQKLQHLVNFVPLKPNEFLFHEEEYYTDDIKKMSNKNMVVVVNHYENDTSWVQRLNHSYVIYNKNPKDNSLYNINIDNVGFDTIVYLKYIISNYENLPDYCCFLQDDCFFHCMDVIEIINNFQFDKEFVPLSASYYLNPNDTAFTEDYAKAVGIVINRPIKMIASCQCIVSKNKILKRSKAFYELLVSTIDKTVKCKENYAIENLWPHILSFNEELVPQAWNCKGYGGNP